MHLRQKTLRLLLTLTLSIAARPSGRADEPGIQRYLVGSLHTFGDFHAKQGQTNFHAAVEQGVFVYASNMVLDADARKVVAKLNGLNEASIEIQVKDGKVVRTGHDGGSGLDTWIEGYDLPAK